MGTLNELTARLEQAGLIALDTVIFIYAFERHPAYGPPAQTVFQALGRGNCRRAVTETRCWPASGPTSRPLLQIFY